MKPYIGNVEEETRNNDNFRKVIFTGEHMQLVLMRLNPGEDIGEETHDVDQFFRIDSGRGVVVVDGKEHSLLDGSGVVVPAGTKHNIINVSNSEPLSMYTIYSRPEHSDGMVSKTKEDAMKMEKFYIEYVIEKRYFDSLNTMSSEEIRNAHLEGEWIRADIAKAYDIFKARAKIPLTPERARELREREKQLRPERYRRQKEGTQDPEQSWNSMLGHAIKRRNIDNDRWSPSVRARIKRGRRLERLGRGKVPEGFGITWFPKGWEGFELGDSADMEELKAEQFGNSDREALPYSMTPEAKRQAYEDFKQQPKKSS